MTLTRTYFLNDVTVTSEWRQSTKDNHRISDEFDFGLDRTIHFAVTGPWAMKNSPIDLQRRKCCPENSAFTFDRIIFKLAGNQDNHKISDEFEFRPDRTMHFGVTFPWVPNNAVFDFVRSIAFLVFIGSLWDLQIIWACIKCHKTPYSEHSLLSFNWNCMKVVANLDMHKISDEFEFRTNRTIHFGVTCPYM